MEEKNIVYTGITQAASDLDCHDGDLCVSHNIISQNGAMRPIFVPNEEFALTEGETLLYIHKTSSYTNYIIQNGTKVQFFCSTDGTRKDMYELPNGTTINSFQSLGNTLIILTSNSIEYALYNNGSYTYLGSKIPDLELGFTLNGAVQKSLPEDVDISNNTTKSPDFYVEISEEGSKQLEELLRPIINKRIQSAKENGHFVEPFFVRYAYRTYSGTAMASPPILMIPNGGNFPYIEVDNFTINGSSQQACITKAKGTQVVYNQCWLMTKAFNRGNINKLKQWKDIILGIDIYVSQPLSRLSSKASKWLAYRGPIDLDTPGDWRRHYYGYYSYGGYRKIGHNEYQNKDIFGYSMDLSSYMHASLSAPQVEPKEYYNKFRNCGDFYKVKSIPLEEIDNYDVDYFTDIDIDGEILENLGVQERLDESDDYLMKDDIYANDSFMYNSRLNITNIVKRPFPYNLNMLSTYTNGSENKYGSSLDEHLQYKIYTFIKANGGIIRVDSDYVTAYKPLSYLYYPNPNAYKMVIEQKHTETGEVLYSELNMEGHAFLNGSYHMKKVNDPNITDYFELDILTFSPDKPGILLDDYPNKIIEKNKIYTSEVNNPFVFPLSGVNTIGTGEILGICSATRALSEGQFGQFPFYVFTSEGIWAMEVAENGLYSAKQPISLDVCSNPDSITQLDGAVTFISDKGLMLISGSNVETISAELDGRSFNPSNIYKWNDILDREGYTAELSSIIPAKDFFKTCRIVFDYPNSRLILYRTDKKYAYVYSILAHTWATMSADFVTDVPLYPDAYLQKSDGKVINISDKINYDDERVVKGVLLTRPIKLGDDSYKTINKVMNRGARYAKNGAIVVFASADGLTYFPIGSACGNKLSRLQGSPYKYFRLAVVADMPLTESISYTSIYYTPKWRNKGR